MTIIQPLDILRMDSNDTVTESEPRPPYEVVQERASALLEILGNTFYALLFIAATLAFYAMAIEARVNTATNDYMVANTPLNLFVIATAFKAGSILVIPLYYCAPNNRQLFTVYACQAPLIFTTVVIFIQVFESANAPLYHVVSNVGLLILLNFTLRIAHRSDMDRANAHHALQAEAKWQEKYLALEMETNAHVLAPVGDIETTPES